MVASRASAVVKRPRFAFTIQSLVTCDGTVEPATGRSPWGTEIPGFASPPRDGFALGSSLSGRTIVIPHYGTYGR